MKADLVVLSDTHGLVWYAGVQGHDARAKHNILLNFSGICHGSARSWYNCEMLAQYMKFKSYFCITTKMCVGMN